MPIKYQIQEVRDFAAPGFVDTSAQVLTDILNGEKTVEEVSNEIDRVLRLPKEALPGRRFKSTHFNESGTIVREPHTSYGIPHVKVEWDNKNISKTNLTLDNDFVIIKE